jgi:sulfonate transport system substrate-binding protein
MCGSAEPSEPLRFAYQNRVGDAISIVAMGKGFFADEGIQVKGILFNNGPACAEALYTGAVDIATMGYNGHHSRFEGFVDAVLASHGAGDIVTDHRARKQPTA